MIKGNARGNNKKKNKRVKYRSTLQSNMAVRHVINIHETLHISLADFCIHRSFFIKSLVCMTLQKIQI